MPNASSISPLREVLSHQSPPFSEQELSELEQRVNRVVRSMQMVDDERDIERLLTATGPLAGLLRLCCCDRFFSILDV